MSAVIFSLSLTITVPVDEGDNPEDYSTWKERRKMERHVIGILEKHYGRTRVDGEVMETEIQSS